MITTIDSMVEETANALLGDHADRAVVEAAEAGTWPAKLWAAITEAGLTTALDDGLEGLGAALAVAKASGAHPAPVPLTETILARGLAGVAGLALPEGPATMAPPRQAQVTATRDGNGDVSDSGLDAQTDVTPPGCDANADPKDSLACVTNGFGIFVDGALGADGNEGT